MPVKMSGLEYREFMKASWGPNAYWEEVVISVDGVEIGEDTDELDVITDASIVTITGGVIIANQSGLLQDQETINAERFARSWLKARSTTSVVLDVPKESLADLLVDLKSRWPRVRVAKK